MQVLQTFEGIFHESFAHHWLEESFTGASSRFYKMTQNIRPFLDRFFIVYFHPNDSTAKVTQIVRPLIYGSFFKISIQNDASTHKWSVGRFASFYKIMKRLSMKVQTICVSLRVELFGRKIYDSVNNMKSSDVHFIEWYWEMKFTWNSRILMVQYKSKRLI